MDFSLVHQYVEIQSVRVTKIVPSLMNSILCNALAPARIPQYGLMTYVIIHRNAALARVNVQPTYLMGTFSFFFYYYFLTLSHSCQCDIFETTGKCDSGCIDETCQAANGYLGEYCGIDYPCKLGVCSATNTCVILQEGENCNSDGECDFNMYCDTTCQLIPPCSDALLNGSCTSPLDICFNGACTEYIQLQEGEACILFYPPMCDISLACVPNHNNISKYEGTCVHTPVGTPCTHDYECESITQNCLCVAGSSTMQCVNSQYAPCAKLTQLYTFCAQNYCVYYDLTPGTQCYSECYQYYSSLMCCTMCNNQEYYDNALFNYAGNCADNTLKQVSCCNPLNPCTILTVSDMCAGYVGE